MDRHEGRRFFGRIRGVRIPETEIRGSAVTRRDSDDEVICKLDSHGGASVLESPGGLMIGPARGRVAGGMVVDQDQGRGRGGDGATENLRGVGEGFVSGAPVDFLVAEEPLAVVEQEDPDRFLERRCISARRGRRRLRETTRNARRRLRPRGAGRIRTPPPIARPWPARSRRSAGAPRRRRGSVPGGFRIPGSSPVRVRLRSFPRGRSEEDGEDLGIAQGGCSAFVKFFAGAFVLGDVLDQHAGTAWILRRIPDGAMIFPVAGRRGDRRFPAHPLP